MNNESKLRLKFLGINTYNEPIIYMREDCHICKSEGFEAPARVNVTLNDKSLIATLNTVQTDILRHNEASLSTYACHFLNAQPGDEISISHPRPLDSLSYIRSKVYGNQLKTEEINEIVSDLVAGQLSDIHIAMLLSATAGNRLNMQETFDLTRAMVNTGERLSWSSDLIVDKHCIGGLPGNRTTLIIVPIVAAFGLVIPKTSSRAITSPAGTADTMEIFAPVNLDIQTMRKIVEKENGCIAWGGAVSLSPADDLLVRIERIMDIDSEGQLVASILSKKIAAGSNHLVIDIPIGATAKIRSIQQAELVKNYLNDIAKAFSIQLKIVMTDGSQPIGRGIGPALEAKDVLAVLSCDKDAPEDLRNHALTLAGHIIEFAPNVAPGSGKSIAKSILESGNALKKFEAICRAQGGIFEIPQAAFTYEIRAEKSGKIVSIDNRYIARIAKLAGAPNSKTSGVELLVKLNAQVEKDQPLFIIHAEAKGELNYALSFIKLEHTIFKIE
ncbi:MAG: thymidine phosphorylase family protein [Gammaproteobacteria bacterium]|nr:thymidine phosphorylase family protein [Gammaproteobacteria bacterium]